MYSGVSHQALKLNKFYFIFQAYAAHSCHWRHMTCCLKKKPIHFIGFEAEIFLDFMFYVYVLLSISPFFVWVVVLQLAVKSVGNTEIDTFMLWEK